MKRFSTACIRYELNLRVSDSELLPCRPELKNISFQPKPCTIFSHAFYIGKPASSTCLSPFRWGEETRSTAPQDEQRYRAFTRLSQFKGFLPTWPEEWPLPLKLTCELILFVTYQKMQGNFPPSCLFSFQIIAPSFRDASCYSGVEESENQCMKSVCI